MRNSTRSILAIVEPFPAILAVFCFSAGEAIRAEGGEVDVVHPKPPDKVGVRQPETRRDGARCANPGANPLARTRSAGLRVFA
ncbi:hypothetical protein N8E89_03410 [Phyllobacterium sp. A18/5-2]|uniref:hypothetical protein n=1 Tax=Phyllobacterium sp. A18/5-2 TaxID=2978392 RepID=UPI0021C87178|nr:hypothetical protein [Phyllobacterium sp. A18/5-2]UXN65992.1 hypothetical protein N8E89_03410 [Phyllobacterium sp. A18/5-2]